ncbi:MAG: rhodanese-like domain-containing protein, partial [Negativicutes bacterium]|nr:rhodanese-like domain-containing protein [Negativicutes bacterium]
QYQEAHIEGAVNIPQDQIREHLDSLDKERLTVTYSNKGVTGNGVQNILINHGFEKVHNLSGGYKNYAMNNKK